MPLDLTTLTLVAKPVTLEEGLNILERDAYRCQYCGLDGLASFENALAMSVDFVMPRARKGKKDPHNPCGLLPLVQYDQGPPRLQQLRRGQNLRARAPRGVAQSVGSQEGCAHEARESAKAASTGKRQQCLRLCDR